MPIIIDSDALDRLAFCERVDIRSPLLLALIALYVQKPTHSGEEERHFTELVLRLLDDADGETWTAARRRLSAYPATPAEILQRLAAGQLNLSAVPPSSGASFSTAGVNMAPSEVSPVELCELFFAAASGERRLILVKPDFATSEQDSIGSASAELARQLEMAALSRNPEAFIRGLERSLEISPALARRIVRDPLGEPTVVVAKALGLSRPALERILLFLNPTIGCSVQRVYELASLFDMLEIAAAQTLVAIWRAAYARLPQPPALRPPHARDAISRRAGTAPADVLPEETGSSSRSARRR